MTRILTNSGLWFDFNYPQVDQVCLHDIAHALSRICRFGGHTYVHYSVAQHSVVVADLVRDHGYSTLMQKHGLLHDAHEAMTGDIVSPLKDLLIGIKPIELRIDEVIRQAFAIPAISWHDRNVIKTFDKMAYEIERGSGLTYHDPTFKEAHRKIVPLHANAAYNLFIDKFNELIGEK